MLNQSTEDLPLTFTSTIIEEITIVTPSPFNILNENCTVKFSGVTFVLSPSSEVERSGELEEVLRRTKQEEREKEMAQKKERKLHRRLQKDLEDVDHESDTEDELDDEIQLGTELAEECHVEAQGVEAVSAFLEGILSRTEIQVENAVARIEHENATSGKVTVLELEVKSLMYGSRDDDEERRQESPTFKYYKKISFKRLKVNLYQCPTKEWAPTVFDLDPSCSLFEPPPFNSQVLVPPGASSLGPPAQPFQPERFTIASSEHGDISVMLHMADRIRGPHLMFTCFIPSIRMLLKPYQLALLVDLLTAVSHSSASVAQRAADSRNSPSQAQQQPASSPVAATGPSSVVGLPSGGSIAPHRRPDPRRNDVAGNVRPLQKQDYSAVEMILQDLDEKDEDEDLDESVEFHPFTSDDGTNNGRGEDGRNGRHNMRFEDHVLDEENVESDSGEKGSFLLWKLTTIISNCTFTLLENDSAEWPVDWWLSLDADDANASDSPSSQPILKPSTVASRIAGLEGDHLCFSMEDARLTLQQTSVDSTVDAQVHTLRLDELLLLQLHGAALLRGGKAVYEEHCVLKFLSEANRDPHFQLSMRSSLESLTDFRDIQLDGGGGRHAESKGSIDYSELEDDCFSDLLVVSFQPAVFDIDLRLASRLESLMGALAGEEIMDALAGASLASSLCETESIYAPSPRTSFTRDRERFYKDKDIDDSLSEFSTSTLTSLATARDAKSDGGSGSTDRRVTKQRTCIRAAMLEVNINFPVVGGFGDSREGNKHGEGVYTTRGWMREERLILQMKNLKAVSHADVDPVELMQHALTHELLESEWSVTFQDVVADMIYRTKHNAAGSVSVPEAVPEAVHVGLTDSPPHKAPLVQKRVFSAFPLHKFENPHGDEETNIFTPVIKVLSRTPSTLYSQRKARQSVFLPTDGSASVKKETTIPLSNDEDFFRALPGFRVWEASDLGSSSTTRVAEEPEDEETAEQRKHGYSGGYYTSDDGNGKKKSVNKAEFETAALEEASTVLSVTIPACTLALNKEEYDLIMELYTVALEGNFEVETVLPDPDNILHSMEPLPPFEYDGTRSSTDDLDEEKMAIVDSILSRNSTSTGIADLTTSGDTEQDVQGSFDSSKVNEGVSGKPLDQASECGDSSDSDNSSDTSSDASFRSAMSHDLLQSHNHIYHSMVDAPVSFPDDNNEERPSPGHVIDPAPQATEEKETVRSSTPLRGEVMDAFGGASPPDLNPSRTAEPESDYLSNLFGKKNGRASGGKTSPPSHTQGGSGRKGGKKGARSPQTGRGKGSASLSPNVPTAATPQRGSKFAVKMFIIEGSICLSENEDSANVYQLAPGIPAASPQTFHVDLDEVSLLQVIIFDDKPVTYIDVSASDVTLREFEERIPSNCYDPEHMKHLETDFLSSAASIPLLFKTMLAGEGHGGLGGGGSRSARGRRKKNRRRRRRKLNRQKSNVLVASVVIRQHLDMNVRDILSVLNIRGLTLNYVCHSDWMTKLADFFTVAAIPVSPSSPSSGAAGNVKHPQGGSATNDGSGNSSSGEDAGPPVIVDMIKFIVNAYDCSVDYNPPTEKSRMVLLLDHATLSMNIVSNSPVLAFKVDARDVSAHLIDSSDKVTYAPAPRRRPSFHYPIRNQGSGGIVGSGVVDEYLSVPCACLRVEDPVSLHHLAAPNLIRHLEDLGFVRIGTLDFLEAFIKQKTLGDISSYDPQNPYALAYTSSTEIRNGELSLYSCCDSFGSLLDLVGSFSTEMSTKYVITPPEDLMIHFENSPLGSDEARVPLGGSPSNEFGGSSSASFTTEETKRDKDGERKESAVNPTAPMVQRDIMSAIDPDMFGPRDADADDGHLHQNDSNSSFQQQPQAFAPLNPSAPSPLDASNGLLANYVINDYMQSGFGDVDSDLAPEYFHHEEEKRIPLAVSDSQSAKWLVDQYEAASSAGNTFVPPIVESYFPIPDESEKESGLQKQHDEMRDPDVKYPRSLFELVLKDINVTWRIFDGRDWGYKNEDEAKIKKKSKQKKKQSKKKTKGKKKAKKERRGSTDTTRDSDSDSNYDGGMDDPSSPLGEDMSVREADLGVHVLADPIRRKRRNRKGKGVTVGGVEVDSRDGSLPQRVREEGDLTEDDGDDTDDLYDEKYKERGLDFYMADESYMDSLSHDRKSESSRQQRLTDRVMEFKFLAATVRMETYAPNEKLVSRTSIAIRDVEVHDYLATSPFRKFLCYYRLPNLPGSGREMHSCMFRMELLNTKVDIGEPSERLEIRSRMEVLPLRLNIDQDAVEFLVEFFTSMGGDAPSTGESDSSSEGDGYDDSGEEKTAPPAEAEVSYIQAFSTKGCRICIDYAPKRVKYNDLREGDYSQLVHMFPLEGVDVMLKPFSANGVEGWGRLFADMGEFWATDIRKHQPQQFVAGLRPIRSVVNLGSGAMDLVMVPCVEYQKNGRVLRGIRKGADSFVRSVAMETLDVTTRLANAAQSFLESVDDVFQPSPSGHEFGSGRRRSLGAMNHRRQNTATSNPVHKMADQPKTFRDGLSQAYDSVSRNFQSSLHHVLVVPREEYERSGASASIRSVLRAIPRAVLRPMIGATEAISKTLMGAQNAYDPKRKLDMDDRYKSAKQ